MEKLFKNGYFDESGNPFANNGEVGNKEANLIRTACLNFARDQYQLIRCHFYCSLSHRWFCLVFMCFTEKSLFLSQFLLRECFVWDTVLMKQTTCLMLGTIA